MNSYYFNDNIADPTQLVAFEPGFQMIAGDSTLRNASVCDVDKPMSEWNETDMTQQCLAVKMLGFNCLDYSKAAEGAMVFHDLRNKTYLDTYCKDGIRAELQFPSCGNGSLDSIDHKSHVLYPNLGKTGDCPQGFEHRYPVLFYETIYTTNAFKNVPGRFVFANGDPTGYGYHGDFISGWPQDVLTQAVHTCTNKSGLQQDCPVFQLQSDQIATSCQADVPPELMHENYIGPMANLPGNVAIAYGPGPAMMGMSGSSPAPQSPTSSTQTMPVSNTTSAGSTNTLSATDSSSTDSIITLSISNASSASPTLPVSTLSPPPTFKQTSYTNTSAAANATTSLASPTSFAGSTSQALPPMSTPTTAPTATQETMTGAFTYTTATSSFISNGVFVDMVLVEEVQTVTVELTQYETASVIPVKHRRHRGHVQHFRGGVQL